MRKYKIIIPSVIGFLIVFLIFYPSLLLPLKYRTVDIIGTVDYTGLPEQKSRPVHGYKYLFYPEMEERSKIGDLGRAQVVLIDDQLSPALEGKKVRIQGTFIEKYEQYMLETFQMRSSADPTGPVIIVKDLVIL